MTMREYTFERFIWCLKSAEPNGPQEVNKLLSYTRNEWKKDYRLLAALWICCWHRWWKNAETNRLEFVRVYQRFMEEIADKTVRKNLSWEDYRAFCRNIDRIDNWPEFQYEQVLNDR